MTEDLAIETRFTLEARIGRGGAGDVFRARDRLTGATVAVKRMLGDEEDPSLLDRFQREARLLARIDHPNVVRYVAHGVDAEARPCLVVEWLEGEDLARRQRRQRLSSAEAFDVVRQAAVGLSALHEAGIVHRDIKPANLFLVEPEGGARTVKIIDLGIARAATETTMTSAGVALGTPFYMSPEQARGEQRVTHRADIFSLGVVLFELLSGRRPFPGDDFFAVLAKIVLQEPPRLREVFPGAPPEIDALVARAMSKPPEVRFPSALDFAEALLALPAFVIGEPAISAPPAVTMMDASRRRSSVPPDVAALSNTEERRVITAVFAGLSPQDDERDLAIFDNLAAAHGAASHTTLGRRRILVFGGARTIGDEALRAARAALDASARLPSAKLSIATGRALASATGLSGDLIERGAADVARDGEDDAGIRVDEATARLIGERFVVEREGSRHLLKGQRAAFGPMTLLGRRIPCIGRDREIGNLDALYRECVDEPVARAALVTGPAGIGKSRLRNELVAKLGDADPRPLVLMARGSPLTESSAFGLLGTAIRRLAGIVDGEPLDEQWEKLAACIGRRAPSAVALLGELAGVPERGAKVARDAMLTGDLMRAAWIEWLEAECAAQPVVLVLEDLHWGDRPSVRFTDAALQALEARPFLVVAFARPEVHERFPSLFADRGAQEIRLVPLTAKTSERMVRAALGNTADPTAVQRIVTRAEGNPFYIEELVRAAVEGAGESLPDTVLGMVQARLDALGPEQKRILRAASVFGQTFWRGGLAALLGEPPDTLAPALDRLLAMEVFARRSAATFPGEVEYTFRHAVVREAAYTMLADADRRVGHGLAAKFLERAGEVDPALLALHFEQGDDPAAASHHHQRAALKALAGNDFLSAIDHAERAFAGTADPEARGRARLVQAEAHRWRAELSLAAQRGAEAAELLPRGETIWFHALRETMAANGRLGQFDLVLMWADEALSATPAPGSESSLLAALAPSAQHMVYAGNHEGAAHLRAELDRVAAAAPRIEPLAWGRVHIMRAVLADHEGDGEAALAWYRKALASFEEAGDRRNLAHTLSNLGFALATVGAYVEAEDALRRAHANAARMGLGVIAPFALHNLGGVLHCLGNLEEARAVEAEAANAFERAKDPRLEGAARVYLARILITMNDLAGAEAEARRVIDQPASTPPVRAGALSTLACTLLAQGRPSEALASAIDAHALLVSLGAIEDFDALVGVAYAEALHAAGDTAAAQAAIIEARRRIHARAARMSDEGRARFLSAVPDNARCLALASAWGVGDG